MKNVLVFGAGKSATVLIEYLLFHAAKEEWIVYVADANRALAEAKINHSSYGRVLSFDILKDKEIRQQYISTADIVISLLPPALHSVVAKDCVKFSRNLLTASYIDQSIQDLKNEIEAKNLFFLCEMGLDPGIDHMSAMELIHDIHSQNGNIISFQSHCGGLIAPESDDNPWHYKISWNPRNIVLAGKAGARYRENGNDIILTYEDVFTGSRRIGLPDGNELSWYPNRDSLPYINLYDLENVSTFIRTTLRHPDFISGWKNIINLKLTDETPQYATEGKTLAELFEEHFNKYKLREQLADSLQSRGAIPRQLIFLGIDDKETKMPAGHFSPADLLQFALETKLALQPADKDMIVMIHEIEYELNHEKKKIISTLVVKGDDHIHTAMAKTVGLPLGIAARLILQDKIQLTGLHIPTHKSIYEPVLAELKQQGIEFSTTETGSA